MESNHLTMIKQAGKFLLASLFFLGIELLLNFPSILVFCGFTPLFASVMIYSAACSLAVTIIWPVPLETIDMDIREMKLHLLWSMGVFFLSTFCLYQLVMITGLIGVGHIGMAALAMVSTSIASVLLHKATTYHARYVPEGLAISLGLAMIFPSFLSQPLYAIGFMLSYAGFLYVRQGYEQDESAPQPHTPPASPRSTHSPGFEEYGHFVADSSSPDDSSTFSSSISMKKSKVQMRRYEIAVVAAACIFTLAFGTVASMHSYALWLIPVVAVSNFIMMIGGYIWIKRHVVEDDGVLVNPMNLLAFNIGFTAALCVFGAFLMQNQWATWFAIRAVECIGWSQFIPQLAAFDLMVMVALYYVVEDYKVEPMTLAVIFSSIAIGGCLLNLLCPSLLFLFTPELEMGSFLFMCAATLFCSYFCNAFTYDGVTDGQNAASLTRAYSPTKGSRMLRANSPYPDNANFQPIPTNLNPKRGGVSPI